MSTINKKYPLLLSVLGLSAALGATAAEQPQQDLAIDQSAIDFVVKRRAAQGVPLTDEIKQDIKEDLLNQSRLADQALRKQLDKNPEVEAHLKLDRLAILSKAYLDAYFKEHPVTEDSIRDDYESKRTAGKFLEYKIRQIVVHDKAEAEGIIKQLKSGADFSELAKHKSHDPGAEHHGGNIGWFRPDIFIDEAFASAVTHLKKGELTAEPVKTRYGWNIITLDDGPRKVTDAQPYEHTNIKLRGVLREKAEKKQVEKLLSELKAASPLAAIAGSNSKTR